MNMQASNDAFWGTAEGHVPVDPSSPLLTFEFVNAALATARIGSWQVDLLTGLATWDNVTSEMFGLQKEPITAKALLPVHEDDRSALWESLQRCGKTGELHDMIFRGLHIDGGIRWLHAIGGPFPKMAENPRYIAGIVCDVTEQKLADEARRESERQLTSLIAHLPGVAYRCEVEAPWKMRFVSEAVLDLTGYAVSNFLSGTVTWGDLILVQDRAMVDDHVRRAIAEKKPFDFRYRITCASGEIRWVQERGSACFSTAGEAQFIEGFIGDVHEQTLTLERLRETEDLFRLGAEATQDVLWDYNLCTGRVSWNTALQKGLGYSPDEMETDCNWWEQKITPEDRDRVLVDLASSISSEDGRFESQYRFAKADGTFVDVLDRGYVIRDEIGMPIRMVGAMLDNTERNAAARTIAEREAQLRNIFGQALVGIMEVSHEGRPTLVNSRFCEILGRTAEEITKLNFTDYTHPDDLVWNIPLLHEKARTGSPIQVEKRYVRPDGSIVWCNVSVSFVRNEAGKVTSEIVVAEDISEKKEAEAQLQASELLYRSILEASADCIKIINLDGRLELMNAPGARALELESFDAIRGKHWIALWPAESRKLVRDALSKAERGESARFSASCPTALGTPKWWDVVVSPMLDSAGQLHKILAISRDITVQRNVAAEVKWHSEHDALTGLANRRGFEARLQAATLRAMQRGSSVGLLLLDLDHFKHVNDTLGHAAGDHLLSVFGKRLTQCVRGDDFVARLGGDEFAIILEDADDSMNLPDAGNSILQRLQEPIRYNGRVMSAGASIGGALFPRDAASANELFNNADTALYALKGSGRGGTRMFHQHMREQAQLASSQLSLARSAVTQKSVEPHYQQKIDLSTGRIAGFEALLRWRHATRGIQLPDTVSEAFKDYELATKIGDLMQRRVFSDVRRWLDDGLPIGFVAINAAPVEFLRDDFAERLLARMQEKAIPPHLVEIEVTEHVFIERGSDFVGRALKMLSRSGVRIALDDFGTGYSSLSHLRDYPVDVVKIDRSFIEKVTVDDEVRAIVCAVIDLAKSLNIEVVAEGVETEVQREMLVRHGCELGQGYLFGRPVEADEVNLLLQGAIKRRKIAI